jgi:anti-anti-sigma factor
MGAKDRVVGMDPPEPFGVETSRHDGQWLVAVRGELDLATVGTLEAELNTLARPAALDLRRVSFIDSVGLTTLVQATREGITVAGVSSEVLRLLRICGLEDKIRYAG